MQVKHYAATRQKYWKIFLLFLITNPMKMIFGNQDFFNRKLYDGIKDSNVKTLSCVVLAFLGMWSEQKSHNLYWIIPESLKPLSNFLAINLYSLSVSNYTIDSGSHVQFWIGTKIINSDMVHQRSIHITFLSIWSSSFFFFLFHFHLKAHKKPRSVSN